MKRRKSAPCLEKDVKRLFSVPVAICVAPIPVLAHPLFDVEEALLGEVSPKRHREYSAGRTAARMAMAELGAPIGPLVSKSDRTPAWPDGVAGSISHGNDLCGAIVADARACAGIGFDLEDALILPDDVDAILFGSEEIAHMEALPALPSASWKAVCFSAKEAFFKAYYPRVRRYLDFLDVSVTFSVDAGGADGSFHVASAGDPDKTPGSFRCEGRWMVRQGTIFTGCTLFGGAGPELTSRAYRKARTPMEMHA